MATSDRSLLEETQKQLRIMTNRNFILRQMNLRKKAAMTMCKCDAKTHFKEQPAKRQRVEIPTDPLELPEPCAMRILRFLTPKELIEATEVSSYWKRYIKSRKKLMKRATSGTVVNIDYDKLFLIEALDASLEDERDYKHMNIFFSPDLMRETISFLLLYPATKRSLTLETLRTSLACDVAPVLSVSKFPNLVKLELKNKEPPFEELSRNLFPQLTTLKIEFNEENYDGMPMEIENFKKFLRAFPKLKHLTIALIVEKSFDDSFEESPDTLFEIDDYERWRSVPRPIKEDPTQPKLETIVLPSSNYFPKILRSHQNSLTKLMLGNMTPIQLFLCLRDLKHLKCLSVTSLHRKAGNQAVAYPQHNSMEVLKIRDNYLNWIEFRQVLNALPSLKELAVREFVEGYYLNLEFIAFNMANLEWYRAGDITQEDHEAYWDIQFYDRHYINTTFEHTSDGNVNYDGFEEDEM